MTVMLRLLTVFVSVTACLVGCATGPPVQELSDARQAIQAAHAAGATDANSPDLYAAQAAIVRAETHLEAHEYTRARLAANAAKRHASEALGEAQQGEAAHPGAGHAKTTPGNAPATPH